MPQLADEDTVFVISVSGYSYEIAEILKGKWGIGEERLFSLTTKKIERNMYDVEAIKQNTDKISYAESLMADETSKEYFRNILQNRLSKNPLFLQKQPNMAAPFVYDNGQTRIAIRSGMTILDCGAFIGDTAELFLNQANGKARIYCFEPLAGNYQELLKWITENEYGDKVFPIQCMLSDKEGSAVIHSAEKISMMAADDTEGQYDNEVEVKTLDGCIKERVDYIKMDIEGAEPEALLGARRIIQRDMPDMMISAYHKTAHMWELPILIHEFCPNYKIFCGHAPNVSFEPEFYITVK